MTLIFTGFIHVWILRHAFWKVYVLHFNNVFKFILKEVQILKHEANTFFFFF